MMESKVSVGIIGCGWLGAALAGKLIAHGHTVIGTSRTPDKVKELAQAKIIGEQLDLPLSTNSHAESLAVFHCNTLVISITPGIRQGRKDYADNVREIVANAQRNGVEHVILLNTTAIYNGLNGYVDELSELKLEDPKVKLLRQAEHYVENYCGRHTIFRLSGLVGPNRHPGRFYSSDKKLSEPNAFVNLIHQLDVIDFLFEFIIQNKPTGIFNASSSMEVSKGHFYKVAAHALGNTATRSESSPSKESGKLIVSDKLRANLDSPFIYDDLVSWVMTHKD